MTKRIYKFDNLKIVLIFLVVLGYLIDQYIGYNGYLKTIFIFIYLFHLTLFIFLTGFSRYDRISEALNKNIVDFFKE